MANTWKARRSLKYISYLQIVSNRIMLEVELQCDYITKFEHQIYLATSQEEPKWLFSQTFQKGKEITSDSRVAFLMADDILKHNVLHSWRLAGKQLQNLYPEIQKVVVLATATPYNVNRNPFPEIARRLELSV